LGYEKRVSTGAKAKISISSFCLFSTASAIFCLTHRSKINLPIRRRAIVKLVADLPIGA
jgi:hypothetical protein